MPASTPIVSWRGRRLLLAVAVVLLGCGSTTSAGLIGVQLGPPVILGVNGELTYTASNGQFTLNGSVENITDPKIPGGSAVIKNGTLSFGLIVDQNGQFDSNGSGLVITGEIDFDGDGTADVTGDSGNPLLSGSFTNFGAAAAGPPTVQFDTLFQIDGGKLTSDINLTGGGTHAGGFTVGDTGGVTLSAENVTSGILGAFQSDFSSSAVKSLTGNVVPEPSSLVLISSALGCIVLAGALRLLPRRMHV